MEKRYKNGLVLGKFLPPHRGHLYLIDTAIENCEHVDVILCHNSTQSIPLEIRLKTLEEIYKGTKSVTIHHKDDTGLPQHDTECETLDEFYSHWVPLVYDTVKNLDVVFTSEDYGDDFAKYLGISHFLVDRERKKYPVSGTQIRTNPFDYWEFIPKEIKPFFIKRIAIMGPESTGKSTLSEKLSEYFKTNFVEEYGRTVYENNGNKITIDDFIPISEGRQKIEDSKIMESNKIIISDTEDITTYIFSRMFFPDEYKNVENWFINTINSKPKYDIYIILNPDCDGIQDGTRVFLDQRYSHYDEIKKQLEDNQCKYVEIGGTWENRLLESIKIIKSEFNI